LGSFLFFLLVFSASKQGIDFSVFFGVLMIRVFVVLQIMIVGVFPDLFCISFLAFTDLCCVVWNKASSFGLPS
jgi:hypothetical protein